LSTGTEQPRSSFDTSEFQRFLIVPPCGQPKPPTEVLPVPVAVVADGITAY